MSDSTDSKDTSQMFDNNLEKILQVAENIRKMAEIEADDIIEDARKRAVEIQKKPVLSQTDNKESLSDREKGYTVKTEVKERAQPENGVCSKEVFYRIGIVFSLH